jgi:serine/threonine protein kinase
MINNKYLLIEKVGNGSFGSIYKGKNSRTNELVAIKIEPISNNTGLLKNESNIYQYLLGTQGIPQIKWYGKDNNNYYMVINLLGKSLDNLITERQQFSLKLTLQIGIQLLYLLKAIHDKGLVHRDIKPDNFLLGLNDDCHKLFLIDFGLCKTFLQDNKHIEMKRTSSLIGSMTFASINAHQYTELSRRDDLESLGYMLVYFVLGQLPWREIDFSGGDVDEIIKYKTEILDRTDVPCVLREYMTYVRNLEFKEKPNYELFIHKFKHEIAKP